MTNIEQKLKEMMELGEDTKWLTIYPSYKVYFKEFKKVENEAFMPKVKALNINQTVLMWFGSGVTECVILKIQKNGVKVKPYWDTEGRHAVVMSHRTFFELNNKTEEQIKERLKEDLNERLNN